MKIIAQASQTLAMALHELATNASKYGALSNHEGSIELTWNVVAASGEDQFAMAWREKDGPLVTPPSRRGFGSKVILDTVRTALNGAANIAYSATGIVWFLTCPARNIVDESNSAPGYPLRSLPVRVDQPDRV